MKKSEILKKCVLFSELSPKSIEELSQIANQLKINKGEILFSEGDKAKALYILIDGSLNLIKLSPEGKEQLVRGVKPNEMFAEAAVFSGTTFPATAVATTKSSILEINKEKFVSFVASHPDVSLKIMGVMAKLLRHLNNLLAELSLGSVTSRLAGYLLECAKKENAKSFELGMQKRELALKLGTIPETLSRNLRKLKREAIIDVLGSKIKILNINKLKHLSA